MRKLFLFLFFVSACSSNATGRMGHGDTGNGTGDGTGGTGTGGSGGTDGGAQPSQGCDKMDILFVIDNSGSMGEEQTNLAQNFPKFIDVLNAYQTGTGNPLDYHVGVTTTSLTEGAPPIPLPFPIPLPMGDDGALHMKSECGMTRTWIERTDTDAAKEFACVAQVGTDGSGMEQPLEAARLALTDRIADGKNAGFMRDDALLAVVILTDEDDQSVDPAAGPTGMELPVDDFITAFDKIKGTHGRWASAVTAGPMDCMSAFGSATEAARLKDYVQKTGAQAVFSSICDGDLSKSLDDALHTFSAACDSFPPIP
jgi:hypothetical protein